MVHPPASALPYSDSELALIGRPDGPEPSVERLLSTLKALKSSRDKERMIARQAASRLESMLSAGTIEPAEELDRLIEHFGATR